MPTWGNSLPAAGHINLYLTTDHVPLHFAILLKTKSQKATPYPWYAIFLKLHHYHSPIFAKTISCVTFLIKSSKCQVTDKFPGKWYPTNLFDFYTLSHAKLLENHTLTAAHTRIAYTWGHGGTPHPPRIQDGRVIVNNKPDMYFSFDDKRATCWSPLLSPNFRKWQQLSSSLLIVSGRLLTNVPQVFDPTWKLAHWIAVAKATQRCV